MEIIDYYVYYYNESTAFCIIFSLFFLSSILSLALIMCKITEKLQDECEDKYKINAKIVLLSCIVSIFLFTNMFTIYSLGKKPFIHIDYINNNINQETVKSKKEIIDDIINENVIFGHNHDLKYYTYRFEITEEEASQLKKAQKKFDERNKEIDKENELKVKTGNVKFTD